MFLRQLVVSKHWFFESSPDWSRKTCGLLDEGNSMTRFWSSWREISFMFLTQEVRQGWRRTPSAYFRRCTWVCATKSMEPQWSNAKPGTIWKPNSRLGQNKFDICIWCFFGSTKEVVLLSTSFENLCSTLIYNEICTVIYCNTVRFSSNFLHSNLRYQHNNTTVLWPAYLSIVPMEKTCCLNGKTCTFSRPPQIDQGSAMESSPKSSGEV